MKKIILMLIVGVFLAVQAYTETPKEGLKAIIKLYKSQDFEKLVKERYSELHKAKNEKDVQKVIEMLKKRFSQEKKREQMISFLESALKSPPKEIKNEKPQKTESGNIAKFKIEMKGRTIEYKLYKMKTGLWGFHL